MEIFKELIGPSGLILLSGILGVVAAFWAATEQTRSEKDLREKAEEIARLNKQIAGQVTGGDSFCYLSVGGLNEPKSRVPNAGVLFITHRGKYPLYDVRARIVNLEKFDEKMKKFDQLTTKDFLEPQDEMKLKLAELTAGAGSLVSPKFILGEGDIAKSDFNIFFSARNGFFTQLLRFRKIDGKWLQALCIKVHEGNKQKMVLEIVDKGFPPQEIDWHDPKSHKGSAGEMRLE